MSQSCTTSCTPASYGAVRLGAGLLLTGQAMVLALAVNLTPPTDLLTRHLLQSLVLGAAGLVALLLGGPLLIAAGREVRRGRITVELLFLTTAAGAFAASMQSYITGSGPIYFEVIGVLLVVYTFGQMVLDRQRTAAVAAADAWAASLATARLTDGRVISVAEIGVGDVVEVNPGELIAIDGIVRDGIGFISESAVSGEPFAVVKRAGDSVLAGSASTDAVLRIEATTAGNARQIDRLIAAVESARTRPGSLTQQADRLTRLFLPVVLIAAVVTFVGWSIADNWRTGLFNSMSVLLVACPCALGLATPLVIWSALSHLARHGLIAHSGDAVERLASVDRVIFDKTGTLTEDALQLVDVATRGVDRNTLLRWLACIESKCSHPVARAFASLDHAHGDAGIRVDSLNTIPGCGVVAQFSADGASHKMRIGQPCWLESEACSLRDSLHARAGHRIDVELDGQIVAIAVLSERLREDAIKTVADLKSLGLPVEVWTGDRTVAWSEQFDEVRTGMLPDDKRRLMSGHRHALFVGDGLNDAGALAVAHAGIALASGTDLASEAATFTLTHCELRAIPDAVQLCRESVASMRKVLWRAATYNIIGIALAMFGLIHPVAAALLMVTSSTIAVWGGVQRTTMLMEQEQVPLPWLSLRAVGHAAAFALQGPVWAALFGLTDRAALALLVLFAVIGSVAAILWRRAATLSHQFDMAFGMLTLGNLGMLLGWWADHDFSALPACGCACSLESALTKPWMWLGMLIACNLAMALLARRPHGSFIAMYVGGNLGMMAGMVVGMGIAPSGIIGHFVGMSIGMMLGMALGHELGVSVRDATIKRTAYLAS